jgi:hypothetical protein
VISSPPLDTVCIYVIQDVDSGLYLPHGLLGGLVSRALQGLD